MKSDEIRARTEAVVANGTAAEACLAGADRAAFGNLATHLSREIKV
jgi:hypothetical protein